MSPILEVENLSVEVGPKRLRAVDGVSFKLERGESVGLVGESGCGKTLTARALMRLFDRNVHLAGGAIRLEGEDLTRVSERRMIELRGSKLGMIFQEPMTALNPVMRAGTQLVEAYRAHQTISRHDALARARVLLERVKITDPDRVLEAYPHELSGGMRQRVMIAMALANDPPILLADEPTTALDVTVQAEILELLAELQRERGIAIVLITHDLGIVASACKRAMVMYAGQIVESQPVEQLFKNPQHPYTVGLLRSLPNAADRGKKLRTIPGTVPSLGDYPVGCRFADRCERKEDRCEREQPILFERPARCFFPGEVRR
jgi:peptide/nickel transport system ATP-binding protein